MTATEAGLSQTDFQIKRVAGCIGILQAVAWIIMSIICIALYLKEDPPSLSANTFMGQVETTIYALFLYRKMEPFSHQVLRPNVFFGFMWIYLLLDIVWLITSVCALINANQTKTSTYIKVWSECTVLICGWDLVTVIILGADYGNCLNVDGVGSGTDALCANAILPVLVIAAKGFVLWFVNLTFAWKLYQLAKELRLGQVFQGSAISQLVQPQYFPQVYPQNVNTPGTPYPRQMPLNFNSPQSPYQTRQQNAFQNFDTSRNVYQPQQQQMSQNFDGPGNAYQPQQQQVSSNFNPPGSPHQHQQQVAPNYNAPASPYRRYQQ